MANSPIGISFLPSEENQANGPKQGNLEGDLGQAFKILSLRLPRIQGARSITPQSNLTAQTSGFNPQAAIFEAMIRAMQGGQAPMSNAPIGLPQGPPPVRITPGDQIGAMRSGPVTPATPDGPRRRGPLTRDTGY